MKILVIGSVNYANWIDNAILVEKMEDCDMVLFTGGADVSPELYGEKPHAQTYSDPNRDKVDTYLFKKAIKLDKFVLGICRGSQISTVMAGGKLIQHVNNHGIHNTHAIATNEGIMQATSTHHQMMYPFNLSKDKYDILAFAAPKRSDVYFRNDINVYTEVPVEPEVVWYKDIRALAIQPHPEFMDKDCDLVKWLNKLIIQYVGVNNS